MSDAMVGPAQGQGHQGGWIVSDREKDHRGPLYDPKPPRLAVDGNGYVWRVYPPGTYGIEEGFFSMCPVNPDNSPVPEPITYYVPASALEEFFEWYDGAFDAASLGRTWRSQTDAVEALRQAFATPNSQSGTDSP